MNLFQKKVNEEIDDEIKEELAQEKIDAGQENEFQFEFLECEKRHVFLWYGSRPV